MLRQEEEMEDQLGDAWQAVVHDSSDGQYVDAIHRMFMSDSFVKAIWSRYQEDQIYVMVQARKDLHIIFGWFIRNR